MFQIDEEAYLSHYGILRKSGRYPWGSGKDPVSRSRGFLDTVADLKKQGMSEVDIARGFQILDKNGNINEAFSTTTLRALKAVAKNEIKQHEITQAQRLQDTGMGYSAIGREMGKPESSVRALLAPGAREKSDILNATADSLQADVDKKHFVDVGAGTELRRGISKNTQDVALTILKERGYAVHTIPIDQVNFKGQQTYTKVLALPGTTWGDVKRNQHRIELSETFSEDHGRTFLGIQPPMKLDPKRFKVNWAEDGGKEADGVIFVRPGVKDIELGGKSYAQVRIQVGDTHYMKGMAVYKDGLPKGTDIVFNTNKDRSRNKMDALKELKKMPGSDEIDKDNPFGSNISRQILVKDAKGKDHVTSVMNIVNEEGKWSTWSKTLSSQMLSKQSPQLIKENLDRTHKRKQEEFERIKELTNAEVRRKLLVDFGDQTEKSAVHLESVPMPRTHGHHVILPVASLKPTEVYAPKYRDGEKVVLIRHPHGGTFEIPELTVNNKNREAQRILGKDPLDAVGIHHKVAERLSGADFDGDTVLVIPNPHPGKIKTTPALEQLKGFDPQRAFPGYPGMKKMSASTKGNQMGDITNLITDMTIKGAPMHEIAAAIKHSMVVIDAEKHNLDWKESAKQNGIANLKKKYQEGTGSRRGASTLISRAGAKTSIPQQVPRKASEGGEIDRATGKRVFTPTGKTYTNQKGQVVENVTRLRKLRITENAHDLSSGTLIESLYADHSNRLKSLANEARKEGVNIPSTKQSPSARKAYAKEVDSLNAKYRLNRMNAPLERKAQAFANAVARQRIQDNPNMDDETKKKINFQALAEGRARFGVKRHEIKITDDEWDAIQAGAISPSRLRDILSKADMKIVRQHATPRAGRVMTRTNVARARAMIKNGATRAQVADALGVSLSTLAKALE